MRRKVFLRFFPLLFLSSFLSVTTAPPAQATLSECLSLRAPYLGTSSSLSGTTLTIRAGAYSACTQAQIKVKSIIGSGLSPLYSVVEEISLFNLDACNGPNLSNVYLWGASVGTYLGEVVCTIRVGDAIFPSSRIGSTSSTLQAKFVYDFSATSISISHSPIPGKSSSSSGSSSSSSSGSSSESAGDSVTTPKVVVTCTAPPVKPELKIVYTATGTRFEFKAPAEDKAFTSLHWTFALWDDSKNAWGGWTPFVTLSTNSGQHEVKESAGFSRIAFGVQASNSCGYSETTRESDTKTGVVLSKLLQDQLTTTASGTTILMTVETPIKGKIKSLYDLSLEVESLTTNICEVANLFIIPKFVGTCKLKVKSKSEKAHVVQAESEFEFYLVKAEQELYHNVPVNGKIGQVLSVRTFSRTGSYVSNITQARGACTISKGRLKLTRTGSCSLLVRVPETDTLKEYVERIAISVKKK